MIEIHCRYDELLPIHEVKFHPKNRNNHPKDQIERLAEILKYQGWRYPIKISNLSGCIVSGHGRVLAARHLGLDTVPVQRQDYETEEQEYADLISDNSIASWSELDLSSINSDIVDLGPDFNIDLLGIKDFVVEPIDKLEPQCDEDEISDALPEPKVVQGEIYILGNHRLMCGDSLAITDVENLINKTKIDLVFTDPPYGVNVVGGDKAVGGGKIVKSNYYQPIIGDSSTETAKEAISIVSILEPTDQIWWGANNYAHALPENNGWLYWQKNQTGDFADGELAWTSSKGSIKRFEHTWAGLIKDSERNEKRCHPTQKPVALAEYCFETYSAKSKTVLDLFGGSGSTLIACEKTDRQCFMMELDPHYCGVILDRWQKFTGKKAHREDGMLWDEIKGE